MVSYIISYTDQPGVDSHVSVQEMSGYRYVEKFDCKRDDLEETINRLKVEYKNNTVCQFLL